MADLYKVAYYEIKGKIDQNLESNPNADPFLSLETYKTVTDMVSKAEIDNRPSFFGPSNADVDGYTKDDISDEDEDND